MRTNKNNNELNKIKEFKDAIVRKRLKNKTSKRIFNVQKFEIIISFGGDILSHKITASEADEKQNNLLNSILEFNDLARPKSEPYKKSYA